MKNNHTVRIYVDGFLKFGGRVNGCSVCIKEDESENLHFKRYLLGNRLKNKELRKLSKENKITNFVVEYFAVFSGLRLARAYNADVLYSDSEVVVKQMNGVFPVHNEVLKVWHRNCQYLFEKDKLKILWISRKKMVLVLGH